LIGGDVADPWQCVQHRLSYRVDPHDIDLIIDLNHWQDHGECGSFPQPCRGDSDLASMQSHNTGGDEETQPTALPYPQWKKIAITFTKSASKEIKQ